MLFSKVAAVFGAGAEDEGPDPREAAEYAETVRRLVRQATLGQVEAVASLIGRRGAVGHAAAFGALEELLGQRHMLGVAALAEAGFSPDAVDPDGRCALDFCFDVFSASPADPVALDALAFFALRMNAIRCLQLLRAYASDVDFEPSQLEALGRCMVAGSKFPVVTALRMAEFFLERASLQIVFAEPLSAMAAKFTDTAIGMVSDVRTDHLAALLVTEEDGAGDSAVEVALSSGNKQFTGDARVTRVLNALWSTPRPFVADSFGSDTARFSDLVAIMARRPGAFLRLPIGKYVLESFSYVLFLALFTAVTYKRYSLDAAVQPLEYALYLFAVGFFANELASLWHNGVVEHFRDGWNILDMLIYLCFVAVIAVRMSAPGESEHVSLSGTHVYEFVMATLAVLLFVRVSFVLVIHPTVGPLLRMISRMLEDIRNFAYLLSLFLFGYTLAFYFLLKHELPDEYGSMLGTALVLYRAMLGDFDFSDFDNLDDGTRHFSQILLGSYLFVATVVLLNLLIAMLAESYAAVQGETILEFQFLRASVIVRYDTDNNELPPPFNVVVWALFFVSRFFDAFRSAARGDITASGDERNTFVDGPAVDYREPLLENDDPAAWYQAMGGDERKEDVPLSERRAGAASEGESESEGAAEAALGRVDAFYCGHCHHANAPTTLREVHSRIRAWLGGVGASEAERDLARHGQHPEDLVAERRRGNSASASSGPPRKRSLESSVRRSAAAEKADRARKEAAREAITAGAALVSPVTVVCASCHRVRKPLDSLAKRREDVSLYVFVLLLWLPVFVALLLPFLVLRALEMAVEVVERRHHLEREERISRAIRLDNEVAQLEGDSKQYAASAERKRRWVRRHFATEPKTIDDVHELLQELHGKLKKVRRGTVAAAAPTPSPPDL